MIHFQGVRTARLERERDEKTRSAATRCERRDARGKPWRNTRAGQREKMRHDRAKSSCFEFIGVEKECYEMERAINKTETKREERGSGKREKKDEWKERWKAFQRTTQHLSRKISRLALTLHICFSFIANISKNISRACIKSRKSEIFYFQLFHRVC